jgi:hypothetical protein
MKTFLVFKYFLGPIWWIHLLSENTFWIDLMNIFIAVKYFFGPIWWMPFLFKKLFGADAYFLNVNHTNTARWPIIHNVIAMHAFPKNLGGIRTQPLEEHWCHVTFIFNIYNYQLPICSQAEMNDVVTFLKTLCIFRRGLE